jgi:large subunit ribosomal protein L18
MNRVLKRRRRECKTDYKARRIMLESGLRRIVIRRTNKYFILQLVDSVMAQDRVLLTMSSKKLLEYNWDGGKIGSLKSIPAAYLCGLLFTQKIKTGKLGSEKIIVDLGMSRTLAGCKMFAVVAGLVEGGLDISANEKVFPPKERLTGEHCGLKDLVEKVREGVLNA